MRFEFILYEELLKGAFKAQKAHGEFEVRLTRMFHARYPAVRKSFIYFISDRFRANSIVSNESAIRVDLALTTTSENVGLMPSLPAHYCRIAIGKPREKRNSILLLLTFRYYSVTTINGTTVTARNRASDIREK